MTVVKKKTVAEAEAKAAAIVKKSTVVSKAQKAKETTVKKYKTTFRAFLGRAWANEVKDTNSKYYKDSFFNIKLDNNVKITVETKDDIVTYEGGKDKDLTFVLFPNTKREDHPRDADMRLSISQTEEVEE